MGGISLGITVVVIGAIYVVVEKYIKGRIEEESDKDEI